MFARTFHLLRFFLVLPSETGSSALSRGTAAVKGVSLWGKREVRGGGAEVGPGRPGAPGALPGPRAGLLGGRRPWREGKTGRRDPRAWRGRAQAVPRPPLPLSLRTRLLRLRFRSDPSWPGLVRSRRNRCRAKSAHR